MKTIFIFFLFSFFSGGIFSQVKTIKIRNADTTCMAFIEGAVGDSISLEKLKSATEIKLRGKACDGENVILEVTFQTKGRTKIQNVMGKKFTEDLKKDFQLFVAGDKIWVEILLMGEKEKKLPAIILKIF